MSEIQTLDRSNRPEFAAMWSEFLVEQAQLGSPIEPTFENELVFARLVDSYLRGSLFGFGLMILDPEPCGCLLIGESPDRGLGLRTTWGRTATLWGVYIRPPYRQRGLAHQMQDLAIIKTRELGFASIVSDILQNDPARENALRFGAVPHATLIYVDLKENPRGR